MLPPRELDIVADGGKVPLPEPKPRIVALETKQDGKGKVELTGTGPVRRDMSFAIGIASMATSSSGACERWAYAIDRLRHGHRGRTGMRRG